MTLDDLERQNRGFMDFFGDFGLRDTFQEWIALKPIETDIDKLHMKFLALNLDFDGLSLDFLGSRKPAHEGIKERYPRKSCYFTVVGQSFVKTLEIDWQFANRNCYRLSRVSWALAQISCWELLSCYGITFSQARCLSLHATNSVKAEEYTLPVQYPNIKVIS